MPLAVPYIHVTAFLQLLYGLFIISCTITENEQIGPECLIETGIASWYGSFFHGKLTASGEPYDMESLTAAHKTLPFNTIVHVVNANNNKSVTVRINNRGPFIEGRVIDLSRKAASEIGILTEGLAEVEIYLLREGDSSPELSCM